MNYEFLEDEKVSSYIGLAFSCSLKEDEHDKFTDECKELVCSKLGDVEPFSWTYLDEVIGYFVYDFPSFLSIKDVEKIFHSIELDEKLGYEEPFLNFKEISKKYLLEVIKKRVGEYIDSECRYESDIYGDRSKNKLIEKFTDE